MNSNKNVFLSTGIDHLDDLLSLDKENEESGGILIGRGQKRTKSEIPIVIIEGTTGTGKTTLALQIAHSAARNQKWIVLYYSLEQTFQSIDSVASNFGLKEWEGQPNVDLRDVRTSSLDFEFEEKKNIIYFCKLSLRPFSRKEEADVFEQRFSELNHVFTKLSRNVKENIFILVVLDSITAFAGGRPLERNEIYRLFKLFNNYHILGILTLERHLEFTTGGDQVFFECTRFLSDIVISLTKNSHVGYLLYYLEIIKSRVTRQALGRHLYKIRTKPQKNEKVPTEQYGVVIYPSIHYVLSKARVKMKSLPKNKPNFIIDNNTQKNEKKDLCLVFDNNYVMPHSCTAIVGPNGTHKLALGLNIAMGHFENKDTNLLVLNFAGTGEFNFKGIAWTEFNRKWRNLEKINDIKFEEEQTKFWHTYYGINKKPVVTVVTFRIGQLASEECFDVIERIISDVNTSFSSVLLINTAEIYTGFPLLKAEPLFLPTLLDLFNIHGLVSICIGVDGGFEASNKEANFILLANADYRIVLSHYPPMHELSKEIFEGLKNKKPTILKEQLVSLVLDNVTGRHYVRQPKWIRVKQKKGKNETTIKTLQCENLPSIEKKRTH
ncbi:MAG: AAA family ATPase [Candidatus Lokiarchaeota archaeon]|nr:AAA family ATPase [Candidatus Lokiarchaeota archaeon]